MEVFPWAQWASVLLALLFGALSGVLYDALRILRVLLGIQTKGATQKVYAVRLPLLPRDFFVPKPKRKWKALLHAVLIFLGDFLWLPTVGALFSVFVYWQNDGIFRLYMLLSAVLGFVIYYRTVGRLVLLSAETAALVLRILLFYIAWFVMLPVRLLRFFMQKCGYAVRTFVLLPRYSRKEMHRLLRSAREGAGLSWQNS